MSDLPAGEGVPVNKALELVLLSLLSIRESPSWGVRRVLRAIPSRFETRLRQIYFRGRFEWEVTLSAHEAKVSVGRPRRIGAHQGQRQPSLLTHPLLRRALVAAAAAAAASSSVQGALSVGA